MKCICVAFDFLFCQFSSLCGWVERWYVFYLSSFDMSLLLQGVDLNRVPPEVARDLPGWRCEPPDQRVPGKSANHGSALRSGCFLLNVTVGPGRLIRLINNYRYPGEWHWGSFHLLAVFLSVQLLIWIVMQLSLFLSLFLYLPLIFNPPVGPASEGEFLSTG